MKILIACDSFKDSLPALAVCQALETGIRKAQPRLQTQLFPMADGGEGTAKILTYHTQGQWRTVEVKGPLNTPVQAGYGLSKNGRVAYIDMAEASGLQLVPPKLRNPLQTTSFGTGQLIQNAIHQGVDKIILGIGGSATNDGGVGMANAVGYRFFDKHGNLLRGKGKELTAISHIESPSQGFPTIEVLCDVNNPLYGPRGAAAVYGPQKGADQDMVDQLDQGLQHLAGLVNRTMHKDLADVPGAGAAGGMGYGAMVFLKGTLKSGIEAVMAEAQFGEALMGVDIVITGEGKIDAQTVQGKLISGICQRAGQYGIPVIAVCGALLASPDLIRKIGLQAAFSIQRYPINLASALKEAGLNLESLGSQLANTLLWQSTL